MSLCALPRAARWRAAARFVLAFLLLGASLLISANTHAAKLTVSKFGAGTVTSSSGGINCGTSCSASYANGTSVELTASAASGYSFSGWGGACSGTSATCILSITGTRKVTATFSENVANNTQTVANYSLTVSKSGSGTVTSSPSGINCGTTCSASYASGTSVTLTASAATGYSFSGWGGACSGTGSTCIVSMTAARSASATFSPVTSVSNYTLAVAVSGSGTVTSSPSGINCGTTCSASYASGTSVTLTASAASGYSFSGWGGACSGTSASCTLSMTTASSVTAAFSQSSVISSTYLISWDPVTDPNVTGYRIYYATAPFSSGSQASSIDVGPLTSYEFTATNLGVPVGSTVYFAVTAVGNTVESSLSTVVSGALQ